MLFNTSHFRGEGGVLRRSLGNGSAKVPWMRNLCLDWSIDKDAGDRWLPVTLRVSKCQNRAAHLDLGFAEPFRLQEGQSHLSLKMGRHAKNVALLIHMNISRIMDLVSRA